MSKKKSGKSKPLTPQQVEARSAIERRNAALQATMASAQAIRFTVRSPLPLRQPVPPSTAPTTQAPDRAQLLSKLKEHVVQPTRAFVARAKSRPTPNSKQIALDQLSKERTRAEARQRAEAVLAAGPTIRQCENIVRKYPDLFPRVPKSLRSRTVYLRAFAANKGDLSILAQVPPAMLDVAFSRLAMEANPAALPFIPLHLRTAQMEIEAIQKEPTMRPHATLPGVADAVDRGWCRTGLEAVPVEARTFSACINALLVATDWSEKILILQELAPPGVRHLLRSGKAIRYIDDEGTRRSLFPFLVHASKGAVIKRTARSLSPEQIERAIRVNGWSLCHLPQRLWTFELCKLAFQRSPPVLEVIEERLGVAYAQQVAAGRKALTARRARAEKVDDIEGPYIAGRPWEPDEEDEHEGQLGLEAARTAEEETEEDVRDRPRC